MDETAEIRARLDRIASLTGRGPGTPSLLEEVRRLLEEGERAVRGVPTAEARGEAGAMSGAEREAGNAAAPARAGRGQP